MTCKSVHRSERGAVLMEFAITAAVVLTGMFGVIEFGRAFYTQTALKAAVCRGARYAVVRKNDAAGIDAVKKMTVYNNPNANVATATPVVPGLTLGHVLVEYKNFNGLLLSARAHVSITGYQFQFAVPMFGATVNMPTARASLPGESVGLVPCDIPSGTPFAPCNIVPN